MPPIIVHRIVALALAFAVAFLALEALAVVGIPLRLALLVVGVLPAVATVVTGLSADPALDVALERAFALATRLLAVLALSGWKPAAILWSERPERAEQAQGDQPEALCR